MKCIIYSPPSHTNWVKEFFPGVNPYFLKFLNKPLLEYYIDFCALLGISLVRVINSETGTDLEEYFASGAQWGIDLSYGFAKPEDSISQVLAKNRKFCAGGIFIIYGYQFIRYSKYNQEYSLLSGNLAKSITDGRSSLYYLPDGQNIRELDLSAIPSDEYSDLGISTIRSIRLYYDLNMGLISKFRRDYVLPGYNNEDGAYLGKNIIDKKTTEYYKPIVLGNNVQIQMNTRIGPNVVLGNNVIIDHSTRISNSIIYDHSYIGSELEIENKIVYRKRIIDPISEEVMQIVDSFLVSDIQNNLIENSLLRVIYGIFTIVLIIITTIPYLLFLLFCVIFGMKITRYKSFIDLDGTICDCPKYQLAGYNIFKRFFFRFSLDLYPLYFKVLSGEIALVGNHLLLKETTGIRVLIQLPAYRPGVYDYAGSMLHNEWHENFINDELEYIHTRSFFFDMKVILTCWVSRIFSEWHTIAEYLGEGCESNQ